MVQCSVMDIDMLYLMSSFLSQTEESLDYTFVARDEMKHKMKFSHSKRTVQNSKATQKKEHKYIMV